MWQIMTQIHHYFLSWLSGPLMDPPSWVTSYGASSHWIRTQLVQPNGCCNYRAWLHFNICDLASEGVHTVCTLTQTTGMVPTVTITNWLLGSLPFETHSYHSASVILTAQFHIFSSPCAQTYCCHNSLASAIKKVIVDMILLPMAMENTANWGITESNLIRNP